MTRIPVSELPDNTGSSHLDSVRNMIAACMQCGTCSASCPNEESMDMTPRRMWRLTLLGLEDQVFDSKTFWMCSNCYSCTLRCPRGLPLTRAMNALKREAARTGKTEQIRNGSFYHTFIDNVRTYGRVQETDLMVRWFTTMRDPGLALRFAPMGMRLMRKGKVHLGTPKHPKDGQLAALFQAAEEIESRAGEQS